MSEGGSLLAARLARWNESNCQLTGFSPPFLGLASQPVASSWLAFYFRPFLSFIDR